MSRHGKWKLRPGRPPIKPKVESPAELLARQEAKRAAEERKAERKAERALPPIVKWSRRFGADRREAFLRAYRDGGNAQSAARAVKVPWSTIRSTLDADKAFRDAYLATRLDGASARLRAALGQAVDAFGADGAAALLGALIDATRAGRADPDTMRRVWRAVLTLELHCADGPDILNELLLETL